MSLSLLFHIALIALIGVGGVALLCCGVVYFTRETGQRASRSHSWPTFRIPQQDWDAPSPRAHLAPGLSIDVLPYHLEVHHPRTLPGPDGARRRAASEPAMAVMPTAEADEPLYPLEMTRVAVARAGEPHHRDWAPRPLSPARDGLARWVEAALANATINDTVIDADHGTFTRWLENVVGGDPWDGLGSQDAYLERVCPPARAIAVRQA